jgi:hypothetical protein
LPAARFTHAAEKDAKEGDGKDVLKKDAVLPPKDEQIPKDDVVKEKDNADSKKDELPRKENGGSGVVKDNPPVPPVDGGPVQDKLPVPTPVDGAVKDKVSPPPIPSSPFNGVWTARFTQEGEDRGTMKVVFEGDRFRISDEFLKSPLMSQYKLTPVMVTRFRKTDSTKYPYEGVLAVQGATHADWVDFEVPNNDRLILYCPPGGDFPPQCRGLKIEFTRSKL